MRGSWAVLGTLDFIVSLISVSLLFALIYRYLPARRLPWKVVLIGGVLTAVLFDVGRWAIGLYLAHSTQASAFGIGREEVTTIAGRETRQIQPGRFPIGGPQ